jgi:formylglycine-generating enzyme required for sulfatase activity
MRKLLLLTAIIFSAHCASAQICDELLKDGKSYYNAGNYTKAKERFSSGLKQGCDKATFQSWIDKCNTAIQKPTQPSGTQSANKPATPPSPCTVLLKKGNDKFEAEDYVEAKKLFEAAQKAGCTEAKSWIAACDALIVPQVDISKNSTQSNSNAITSVNGVTFEMVYVQGGAFTMGCTGEQGSDCESNEKPTHRVTLSSYYMGKYEVTQALWKAVMGSNPSYFRGDNLPVENVSWEDANDFIRKLNALTGKNFRLPTEAEWEFAARGGNKSEGMKYSGGYSLGNVGWYDDNSGTKTHSVGQKTPNELGIYDMSGNVYEWCSDWYDGYSSSSQSNPTGASSGSYRVARGGSWNDTDASDCRVAYRGLSYPSSGGNRLGFRLARSSK